MEENKNSYSIELITELLSASINQGRSEKSKELLLSLSDLLNDLKRTHYSFKSDKNNNFIIYKNGKQFLSLDLPELNDRDLNLIILILEKAYKDNTNDNILKFYKSIKNIV